MLNFVPIRLDDFERSATLLLWIESWTGRDELELLTPECWFTRGHDLVEKEWEYNVDGLKMPTVKPGLSYGPLPQQLRMQRWKS